MKPVADYRAHLDEALIAADIRPDPDAVIARARELSRDGLAFMPSRRTAAPVGPGSGNAPHDPDPTLAPFTEALRGSLDEGLLERRMRPVSPRPKRRLASVIAVGLAAAAVVMLVGTGSLSTLFQRGEDGARSSAQQVVDGSASGATEGRATERHAPRRMPTAAPAPPISAPEPVAEPEPEAEPEPAAPPKIDLDERLRRLDDRARADWRAGRIDRARRGFETIVRLGGRRPVVESAYGDLFAITRKQGGNPTQLWGAYLKRFPRGRYAEDALAGLCRRSDAGEQTSCWNRYRQQFPNGMHAPRTP